jgi:hypothetical protein
LLSIIEVHTRKILKDYFPFSIKQDTMITFLSEVFLAYQYPESIVIRSDNARLFIAKNAQEYLRLTEVQQEFTPVAIPK